MAGREPLWTATHRHRGEPGHTRDTQGPRPKCRSRYLRPSARSARSCRSANGGMGEKAAVHDVREHRTRLGRDCKLKAKCTFLACQCARDKMCWVDADEMPTGKDLVNALVRQADRRQAAHRKAQEVPHRERQDGLVDRDLQRVRERTPQCPSCPHVVPAIKEANPAPARLSYTPVYHTLIHSRGKGHTTGESLLKAGLASLTLSWSTQQVH